MNPDECRDLLVDLLGAQNEQVTAVRARFDEIGRAIADNQIDNLQQSLGDSDPGFAQLQQLERQRHDLLQRFGYAANAAAQTACIDWCDDADGQLSALHARLVDNLQALQRSIQLGNLLVGKGRDRIRRSLGILTGQSQSGQCRTYSSSGKAEDGPGHRDIAVA